MPEFQRDAQCHHLGAGVIAVLNPGITILVLAAADARISRAQMADPRRDIHGHRPALPRTAGRVMPGCTSQGTAHGYANAREE